MSKISLNKILDEIIVKYNLDEYYPGFKNKYKAIELLKQLCIEYSESNILCLYDYKLELKFIKSMMSRDTNVEYVCTANLKMLDNYNLEKYDVVLNISYSYYDCVHKKMANKKGKYLWLYDYFKNNGLELYDEFYNLEPGNLARDKHDFDIMAEKLYWPSIASYNIRNNLNKNSDEQDCINSLKKLIFLMLYMRDFVKYEKYLDELKKYKIDIDNYIQADREIKKLIYGVKEKLKTRKDKDVICYWLDQLPYEDHKDMQYLCEQLDRGVEFTNAYTAIPYTNPTLRTILYKEMPMGEVNPTKGIITADKSKLLRFIENKGYVFKTISGVFDYMTIDDKYITGNVIDFYEQGSVILFDLYEELINAKESRFIVVHLLAETHYPYFNNNMTEKGSNDIAVRYKEGRDAIDEQLRWYDECIASDGTKMYFSDHGKGDVRRSHHTVFGVVSSKISAKKTNKIFSYIDFDSVVKAMFSGDDIEESVPAREWAYIQNEPLYNPLLVYEKFKAKKNVSLLPYMGYAGIINDKEIYLEYATGNSSYIICDEYGVSKEYDDNIFDIISQQYLDKLKEKVKCNIVEWSCDEKYKYSQYLKRVWFNTENTRKKKQKIIRDIFEHIGKDEIVAIRGGGEHTYRLLSILSEKCKQKINFIVDMRYTEIKNLYGIEVISPLEIEKHNVSVVVLSSFRLRDIFKEEAKQNYNECKVIDIYDVLTDNGQYGEDEFWMPHYVEEEWNVGFKWDDFDVPSR